MSVKKSYEVPGARMTSPSGQYTSITPATMRYVCDVAGIGRYDIGLGSRSDGTVASGSMYLRGYNHVSTDRGGRLKCLDWVAVTRHAPNRWFR
jgi:hypothetical protein